ncbi:MAG: hypothetical protein WA990_07955 [Rubrobacteraceae bacterium]
MRELLNEPLPGESREELERLSAEDEQRAREGLVELKRGETTYFKHIEHLTPKDMQSRIEAETALVVRLTERTEALLPWLKGSFRKLDGQTCTKAKVKSAKPITQIPSETSLQPTPLALQGS